VDCIAQQVYIPELLVGDWLYFTNMGAYAASAATGARTRRDGADR
jgi:diaminopimelate decarboxylase